MLRRMRKSGDQVPVVTTVHGVEVVEGVPSLPYDVPVDVIVTPTRLIRVTPRKPKPSGLLVEYLSPSKVEETPYLKSYLIRTGRWPSAGGQGARKLPI